MEAVSRGSLTIWRTALCGLKTKPRDRELEEMAKFQPAREVQARHSNGLQILASYQAIREVTGRGISAQGKLKLEMSPKDWKGAGL